MLKRSTSAAALRSPTSAAAHASAIGNGTLDNEDAQTAMKGQLAKAELLVALAATNRTLAAAGLPTLPVSLASLASPHATVDALLRHLTCVAGVATERGSAHAQQSLAAKKSLRRERSQMLDADKLRRDGEKNEAEIRDLQRRLARAESTAAEVKTRNRYLEQEIVQVRKDFHAGTVTPRRSSSSIRSVRRSDSITSFHSTTTPSTTPKKRASTASLKTPAVAPQSPPSESEIMNRAALIAQRHAASHTYDASALVAAQWAVGRAASVAETAALESVMPPQSVKMASTATAATSLPPAGPPTKSVSAKETPAFAVKETHVHAEINALEDAYTEDETPYIPMSAARLKAGPSAGASAPDAATGPSGVMGASGMIGWMRNRRFARTVASSNGTSVVLAASEMDGYDTVEELRFREAIAFDTLAFIVS
ncbi:hypothetical protein BC830DRAFT_35456 [Chytriomyces sp. MP71]|nr:hypothetical protein BC830DRAFT_35456 [Chytriomyces sp. MP71]